MAWAEWAAEWASKNSIFKLKRKGPLWALFYFVVARRTLVRRSNPKHSTRGENPPRLLRRAYGSPRNDELSSLYNNDHRVENSSSS